MKIFSYFFVILLIAPLLTHAQIASSLLQFPSQGTQPVTFDQYINWLYLFSISIAALLAVVKIIIAGFKYVLTDVISTKGEAKDDIKGALLGLLLILGAFVILNTINPELVKNTISISAVRSAPPPPTPAGSAIAPVTNQTPGNTNPAPTLPAPLTIAGSPPGEYARWTLQCTGGQGRVDVTSTPGVAICVPITPASPATPATPGNGTGSQTPPPTNCVPVGSLVEDTPSRRITEFDFRNCSVGISAAIKEARDNCLSAAVYRQITANFSPRVTNVYRCTLTNT